MSAQTQAFAAAAAAAAVVAKVVCERNTHAACTAYTALTAAYAPAAAAPASCLINEECLGYKIGVVGTPACCGPFGSKTCQPQEEGFFGLGTCPSGAATGDAAGAVSADAVPDS